jgi:integrase
MNRGPHAPEQLSFAQASGGLAADWPPQRGRLSTQPAPDADLLAEFRQRVLRSGCADSTANNYFRHVAGLLQVAARRRQRTVTARELFLDTDLLAETTCDDVPLVRSAETPLERRTLGERRIACRAFIRHMRHYLGRDPDELIEEFEVGLRARCERIGLTYRVQAGRPSGAQGYTPSAEEMTELLRRAMQSTEPHLAARNVAFIASLGATGLRVSSVINIEGRDFFRLSAGLFVAVREKGKAERVQVAIPPELKALLERCVEECRRWCPLTGAAGEIGIGVGGPFWRNRRGRPWNVRTASGMVRRISGLACHTAFGPHAIRRWNTQQLTRVMPRAAVADVFRWNGVGILDRHYAPPPGASHMPSRQRVPAKAGG